MIDYYDFMQISPDADTETVHRVYHYLAARFHPDNQKSGDAGMFRLLKTAHDVLTNAKRRAEYDSERNTEKQDKLIPLSAAVDFMDQLDGELNRRVAVLAVLYYQRRRNTNAPEVSLAEIEERMGFPRDYLDFTLWYLQRKGYVAKADNAQYALTADGVDFVETERTKLPILNRLLTSSTAETAEAIVNAAREAEYPMPKVEDTPQPERRAERKERRVGAVDTRLIKIERRGTGPRSGTAADRRR